MKFLPWVCGLAFTMVTVAQAGVAKNELPDEEAQVLNHPGEVTLYSLEPPNALPPQGPTLHGYVILGKIKLSAKEAQIATKALRSAIEGWNGYSVNCFDPRHGLSVFSAGQTFDFVFCYECEGLQVYKDDKPVCSLSISGSPDTLNGLLREHHIRLPKD
jgi:hypothetical protein